jgi:hypothetical protein
MHILLEGLLQTMKIETNMGIPERKVKNCVDEFLELERNSSEKNQLIKGQIYAMTDSIRIHDQISFNHEGCLDNRFLTKPSKVYMSDIKVQVEYTNLKTYPTIVVNFVEVVGYL